MPVGTQRNPKSVFRIPRSAFGDFTTTIFILKSPYSPEIVGYGPSPHIRPKSRPQRPADLPDGVAGPGRLHIATRSAMPAWSVLSKRPPPFVTGLSPVYAGGGRRCQIL